MTIALADTNLFLRALVNDHEHHQKAIAIFDKARSKQIRLVWPSVIFVEVIHALKASKFYHLDRTEIAALLTPYLKLPGLRLEEPEVTERALSIFAGTKLDIADAWLIAKAQQGKVKQIYSFDKDFKNVHGIEWIEP